MDKKTLIGTIDGLFEKRQPFISLCQEIAENFYPERAEFTVRKTHGEEFASNLMTSFPVINRRTLADQLGTMLRPTASPWFHMSLLDEDRETHDAKIWLEKATDIQRRAMYDRKTQFSRASKEADNDYATFGQAIISVRPNKHRNGLLYQNWHIRDVVWRESEEGEIDLIARKAKPTIYDLNERYGDKLHQNVKNQLATNPLKPSDCYHIICDIELFDGIGSANQRGDKPYWSIFYDRENSHIIEAIPVYNKEYCIPRWQTVSGSQYAFSPATITALPDARLIQAMTYTLLEAGEKATNPPVLAATDAISSDISLYAGGVTWYDQEYDQRTGAALQPVNQDLRGLPFGAEMMQDGRAILTECFFLNKLAMPERGPEMTAYEVGQRIQEYIRNALPIFEPMEMEYNGSICDTTFELGWRMGMFGSPFDIPDILKGADVQFTFESPLHDAIEEQKGQKLGEMRDLIAVAAEIDQTAGMVPDIQVALRDALEGVRIPTEWLHSQDEVEKSIQQRNQKMAMQEQLAVAEQGAEIASKVKPEDIESILAETA